MKKSISFISAVMVACSLSATDVQLLVQKVDNQGSVQGNTYRLYAQILDANKNIHAIFGDTQDPLVISTTAPFFQHQFGGYSTSSLSTYAIDADPTLNYDSWITLGYANSESNDLWDIGMSFTAFNGGGNISTENGAWFLLPTDEKCNADQNGLLLLGQFTTTGVVSGSINVQGWDGPNVNWQARNLTFISTDAHVFGCTDNLASNYSTAATYNDGTCLFDSTAGSTELGHGNSGIAEVSKADGLNTSWDVFPNPVRQGMVHVQFKNQLDLKKDKVVIEVREMSGRLVDSYVVNEQMLIGGNRVSVNPGLTSGVYKVVLNQNGIQESKSIVVEK